MQLLRLLADGKCYSGEQLGAQLGVGRAAVWKRVAALRRKGFEIDVIPGKGYCLRTPLELLSTEEILLRVSPAVLKCIFAIKVYECVGSTNDVAAELMLGSGSAGVVCFAEEQSAGRGRRGRQWVSPAGINLYCSIGWSFPSGISQIEGLSLAVGVAVVRALQRYGVSGIELKWPNDLLIGEAKLGGILVELHAEIGGAYRVVVGIGLNLSLSPEVNGKVDGIVTDLSSHMGQVIQRNSIAALVMEEVIYLLEDYPSKGFQAVRSEWGRCDALNGAEVIVDGIDGKLYGVAQGVDEKGALIIKTAEGERLIYGGEVSLRRRLT